MGIRLSIFIVSILLILSSCRKDMEFVTDNSAKLSFSSDSISFDTVFTTIGSITENFLVYNPYKERIKISSIRLNGGSGSNFRINVDGASGNYFEDIEIASEDSMYIFIEVTVDPNNDRNPFVIEDYIEFNTNGNYQKISLVAWGQNAIYYTPTSFNRNLPDFTCLTGPCSDNLPPVDVTWTDSLPYVIYGYVALDTLDKLTIEAGTKVYFHNGGGMWVYRGGSLTVNGTKDNPVIFRGDRLESRFDNEPGQWDRIWINEGGVNRINYAVIENAFIGIQAEALFLNGGPNEAGFLELQNTQIKNCSNTGLLSAFFAVQAENLIVSDCGINNVLLQAGGLWRFDHCSFPNYFNASSRETPAFAIQNVYQVGDSIYQDVPNVQIRNSIITGKIDSEFDIELFNNGSIDLLIQNCILKTEENTSNASAFINILKNPTGDIFESPSMADFTLIENSIAIDQGDVNVGNAVPLDLMENSRTSDNAPDLGAYEYVP